MPYELDIASIRRQFPALERKEGDVPVVFFDGPAGSQVPRRVIDAVTSYLSEANANRGGLFAASRRTDEILTAAHEAVADLLGTSDPDLVCFGPNMTSLTLALSRSLARTWQPGDEVIVTQLDHDANVTPWTLAAQEAGAKVVTVRVDPSDCTLDMGDFESKLSSRTRLVAVCCASNAVGTITPIRWLTELAHATGAQVFLDAVHYAPHALVDVDGWGCDYLACSAYKFFGPHVGILWGKREHLETLPAYKLRPAGDLPPDRWMTGTQNHEGIAGTAAAVDYLASLGGLPEDADRRAALAASFGAIARYERALCERLLKGLAELRGVEVWGMTDLRRVSGRVPTVSFVHRTRTPREVASYLAARGICVWHGNFYALPLTEALHLEPEGLVRVGLLHYNTAHEVDRLLDALARPEPITDGTLEETRALGPGAERPGRRRPDISSADFLESEVVTLMPLLATGFSESVLRRAVERGLEADLDREADSAAAERFIETCPVEGAKVEDYLHRAIEVRDGLHVLAGIRFRGLDTTKAFVEIDRRSATLETAADLAVVRDATRGHYEVFSPRWTRVFLSMQEELRIEPLAAGAVADVRLVAGRVHHLRALPAPEARARVALQPLSDLRSYEEYLDMHAGLYESAPEILESVGPLPRDALQSCLDERTLFGIAVDGDPCGFIGVRRGSTRDLEGFEVVVEILAPHIRGKGLGAAVQRALIDAVPARATHFLFGTIHPENTPSLRAALRVGRIELGGFWFLPW